MITPMQELRRRNDAFINNMLLKKEQHSDEHIKAATIIFEERGLADPAKQALINQYPELQEEVKQKYNDGTAAEELTNYLKAKGMSTQDSQEMIKNAIRKNQNKIEKQNNSKKINGLFVAIGLALLYIIFRIIIRMNS